MKNITVILDNGHGKDTPGKCSPDGSIQEYAYCRDIVKRISTKLNELNIKNIILVPEENDTTLKVRTDRANNIHYSTKGGTILISVHLNAAGQGIWMNARGFSDWVYTGASKNSHKLGRLLYEEAERLDLKGNRYVPETKTWTANFYILKHTVMPAVLTENLFQDNKEDVAILLSEEGKQKIVDLHVEAIKKYLAD